MTLAARMLPLPRRAMQHALLFLKNGAKRFRGGVGMLCVRPFSVHLVSILKSSLDAHRGQKQMDGEQFKRHLLLVVCGIGMRIGTVVASSGEIW